jgi:menaquinol-cytochrome c reductase iron-sulfur subunit
MENQQTRRKLQTRTIVVIAAFIIAAAVSIIGGYFLSPIWETKKTTSTIAIARASSIPIGTPTLVKYQENVQDGWITTMVTNTTWVVTKDGKNFVAFDPHCTHLGCPYYWNSSENCFVCPCHGGEFTIDGKVITGPPPRSLDRLALVINNGEIELTGQIIKVN